MTKIEMSKLELSRGGYQLFQTVFMKLYEAFSKGKEKVIIRYYSYGIQTKEESVGLNGYSYSYYHLKRILCNLNLHGFVKIFKRKPPKPPDWKPGERVYSYLEVRPTAKGFKAFKNGGYCPIQSTTIYRYGRDDVVMPDRIGIGKGFLGYKELKEKYFDYAQKRFKVALSRWYDWCKEFDVLFEVKLIALKEEEAAIEIQKLIDQLVPTLPKRYTALRIEQELKQSTKLIAFA